MNKNINLIAFGTFGAPNGFTQTIFLGNPVLQKSIKTFDVRGQLIIYPNSCIYSIRKEFKENLNVISYAKYTYAQEPSSARTGSFIGSSILFTNKIAEEHITISQLNEFHNQLIIKNVKNDTLLVNHSDKLSVAKPKDFDKMDFHLREIENLKFTQNSDRILVVFCKTSDANLVNFYKKAIDLLNVYNTIYFTESREIAEFVNQKGIFKLVQNVGDIKDFDKEINDLIEERKRKREQSISEFETEVQRINDDKNRTIQEFKTQIEQNERTHSENARKLKESSDDINKIGQFYDDFLNKSNSLINLLKHNNGKLEDVKQIYNSNKILFNNGISELKKPNYTTKITKPKPKSNLIIEHSQKDFANRNSQGTMRSKALEANDYKINIYKVTTLVFAFLLLCTWIYFLFFNSIELSVPSQDIQQVEDQSSQTTIESRVLSPKPNTELNENDYRIVAKIIKYNSKIEDVVKVIFDKNPSEIKSNYTSQKVAYSKHLLELNKECFDENKGIIYFSKDTIRHIPCFKK